MQLNLNYYSDLDRKVMNLADIRKKAEANRRAAALPVEALDESSRLTETDIAESAIPEDSSFDSQLMPTEDFEEDSALAAFPAEEESFSLIDEELPETGCFDDVSPPDAAFSESLPAADSAATPNEEAFQHISTASPSIEKKSAGYNPLETILTGRESAADADDSSLFQAHSYATEEVEEYLCFRVAHEEYAISIMAIKEIVKPREVTEVPRMPQFISGVISLRGVIIPVMDMRLRLSLPVSAATGRERIVVLRMDSGFCGVLVDEVIQVARIKKSDIEEPPAILDGIDRDFVSGLGHFDRRMLILLNLETILDIGVH